VAALLAATDLTGVATVVDVGGGRGAMLTGLLRALPDLHGSIADQPIVTAEAETLFAADGLADRADGVGCDFFASVPGGADLYTIANVLHDWDDADAVRILRSVRAAVPDDGRLLVVEHVLDAPGREFAAQRDLHMVDLHMLVMFGARERTKAEYDALLVAAGFTPGLLAATRTDWDVLEAWPAG
jgi:SAM-dependent methyltransferase